MESIFMLNMLVNNGTPRGWLDLFPLQEQMITCDFDDRARGAARPGNERPAAEIQAESAPASYAAPMFVP